MGSCINSVYAKVYKLRYTPADIVIPDFFTIIALSILLRKSQNIYGI